MHVTLSWDCVLIFRPLWLYVLILYPFRSDGSEADDGETRRAQDPLGVEKNDRWGHRWQQQRHQLQGLCQDDAGEALSCAQTVSPRHHVPFTPKTLSMHVMVGGVSHLLCQPEINRQSCDDEQQCHYPHAALVVNLHSNKIHLCGLSIANPSLSWSGIMCLANWQEADYLPMVTQAWTEKIKNTPKKWVIFVLYSRNEFMKYIKLGNVAQLPPVWYKPVKSASQWVESLSWSCKLTLIWLHL